MNNWSKLFASIVTSSIWQEPLPTKVVWVTMLAIKDSEGRVEGSIPGLASLAGVTIEECETALNKLRSPDKYSRSKDEQGRRIEDIDGGWYIINHFKYRDEKADYKREYNRVKQAEYRRKKKRLTLLTAETMALRAEALGDQKSYDRAAASVRERPDPKPEHPPALD